MQSIQVSTVAVGTLTLATFPLFSAVLEPLLFHEKMRASDIVCALVDVYKRQPLADGSAVGEPFVFFYSMQHAQPQAIVVILLCVGPVSYTHLT